MNITHEQRLTLLKMHNKLRQITQTIHECNDLWTSQVGDLERFEHELHSIFKFTAVKDSEGRSMWYRDWVLEDLSVDPDGEQPDV
jgi:hypothetical protein